MDKTDQLKTGQSDQKTAHVEYKKKAHSVYLLTYHIVFVTKYRRPVITNEIGDFMKNHAAYLCGRFDVVLCLSDATAI